MSLEFHRETAEETNYRLGYLKQQILRGYSRYQKIIDTLTLNFLPDEPGFVAAVTKDGHLCLNETKKFADPAEISIYVRHEILHVLLDHINREIYDTARKLGFDPKTLTNAQFDQVLAANSKHTDFTSRRMNSRSFGNKAADLDLSRYYLQKDKPVIRLIGGLLLDDHPEWIAKHLSFEQMIQACKEDDYNLRRRVVSHKVGTINTDPLTGKKSVMVDYTEDSEFLGSVINKEDLGEIKLLPGDMPFLQNFYKYCASLISRKAFWVDDDDYADPDKHPVFVNGQLKYFDTVTDPAWILPIASVKNADLYINIFSQDTEDPATGALIPAQPKKCTCLNQEWFSIPNSSYIFLANLPNAFNTSFQGSTGYGLGNELKGSEVEKIFKNWKVNLK